MPTRYVYDISARPEGEQRPEGERFISYTYRIRHDLCNLCHRGMPSEVLHLCKQLLHEVRNLIFFSNLRCINCSASTHFIRYKVRGGAFDPPTQGDTNVHVCACAVVYPNGEQL